MADFYQTGVVTTLHRLDTHNLAELEVELERCAEWRRTTLVLPCLAAEFSRPAIRQIVRELRGVRYLDQVVLSLGRATADDFAVAKCVLADLPQRVTIIWNDGPAVRAIYRLLADHGLSPGEDGKGRSCWIAYGYALSGPCDVIALHDCDITTYNRELLARLCYPVVSPELGFEYAKGYYARVAGRMHGRVTRLLVTPLIRTLEELLGRLPLLAYFDSFRYALAGEFAMRADLARVNRVPAGWGLEVGMLAEVYRHCGVTRVCQTELCSTYDHKHQPLSAGNPNEGLLKMCVDVTHTLLAALAAEGVALSSGLLKGLRALYTRNASETIARYQADAAINGLSFDRRDEEQIVAAFARGVGLACERFTADPMGIRPMPSWAQVVSAIPNVLHLLRDAVDADSVAAVAA